jgi:tetratricopeptide (TPR) repeat protein
MASKRKKDRRAANRTFSFAVPLPGPVRVRIEGLLDEDRPEEVLSLIEERLEKSPEHPLLSFYAGCAHAMLGESFAALGFLRTAYRQDRRNDAALYNLLNIYLKLGFFTHALRALRPLLKGDRADAPGDLQELGVLRTELQQQQREAALRFGAPLDRYEEAHYWDEEAQIAQQQGDWAAALRATDQALGLVPDLPPTLNNRSMSFYFTGRLDEAIADAQRVLSLAPKNVHALANLVRYHYLRGEPAPMQAYFARLKALTPDDLNFQFNPVAKMMEAYAVAGTDEEIFAFLEPRAQEEPGRGYYMLGAAAANLGRRSEARRAWMKVADDGKVWKGLAQRALAELEKGKSGLGRASQFPHLAVQELLSPAQLEELIAATEETEDGEPDRQVPLAELAARNPALLTAARWFLWHGEEVAIGIRLLAMLGTEEAWAELRDFALGQAGTDEERLSAVQLIYQAGQVPADQPQRLWLNGRWNQILLKQFLIADQPADRSYGEEVIQLLAQAGQALHDGDQDAAESLYQRALAAEPGCGPAYNNLAAIAEMRGDRQATRAYLEKGLEVDPDYATGRCNLARLHLDEGQVEKAEHLVAPLLERERFTHFELKAYQLVQALIQLHRGDIEAAENILGGLTKMYPDDPEVKQLTERMHMFQPLGRLRQWFRENTRRKRERDDDRPLDEGASLETCLDRHNKETLQAMARQLGLSGLSARHKPELIRAVAAQLRDLHALRQVGAALPARARQALDYLLEQGGQSSWTEFARRYGDDRAELSYGPHTQPKTTMGILRLAGLLFAGTRAGQRQVQIPAELRLCLQQLPEEGRAQEPRP